jgi:hypothetical protein
MGTGSGKAPRTIIRWIRESQVTNISSFSTQSLTQLVLPNPAGADTRVNILLDANPSFNRWTWYGRRINLRWS